MKPQIKAMYLSVKDMGRAIDFYESIFETQVSSRDDEMSSFDFEGLSLLLFNPAVAGEDVQYGNNAIPNIEVDDAKALSETLISQGRPVVMPLTQVGTYLIFQVEDTEGNVIEFYQKS